MPDPTELLIHAWVWALNHTHPGLAESIVAFVRDAGEVSPEQMVWSAGLCLFVGGVRWAARWRHLIRW